MGTVQDLIQSSLRLLQASNASAPPTSQELADGLEVLNSLIDSWANERLMVYSVARNVYPLTPGQQTYTMGPGANIDAPRPIKIERAGIVVNSTPQQPMELPLTQLSLDDWANRKIVKVVPSNYPTEFYNDYAFPNCNIGFWPYPIGPCSVAIYAWQGISLFAALTDTVSLPPGYYRALRYNLALELASEYGITPSAIVATIALDSKNWIRTVNTRPIDLNNGPSAASRGRFNIFTGGFK